MLYQIHELQHSLLTPARLASKHFIEMITHPLNPMSKTPIANIISANAQLFERATRRFGKPEFGLNSTMIDDKEVSIEEIVITEKPFCNLINFKRDTKRNDPNVLLVSPMSGHYATLNRGTVEALLPHHNVFVTDWANAKEVPLSDGKFDLDDYIKYLWDFLDILGPDTHVMAICQPAPLVLATVALMATKESKNQPLSITLMGGPIDTRVSKTEVTKLAEERPISWFKNTVINKVPPYYSGGSRKVYPGFIQLSGFMSMNLDKHIDSHINFYQHLVKGDGDSAESHKKFYNEYLSVMDLTSEFFLQTVEKVFQKHSLPKGEMIWTDPEDGRTYPVKPQDIKRTALLTIEGEKDDISAAGQTAAAHILCTGLSPDKKFHHLQEDVGHYGIFNGKRWRNFIMPRIRHFIRDFDKNVDPVPISDIHLTKDLKPEKFNKEKHYISVIDGQKEDVKKTART